MLRTLIVDDEELARMRMRKLLEPYSTQVEIVGEAQDGVSAVEKIRELSPDLVFLDIQMPGMSGLEVVSQLKGEALPWVVFATAYDEYAIRAFEKSAIDYLLKPVEADRLKTTMAKLERLSGKPDASLLETVRKLMEAQPIQKYLERIQVRIGDRTLLLPITQIVRFEAEDKYTTVHTDESKYVIDTPLVELEAKLNPEKFMRIHRAHLVNTSRIAEIQRQFGGRLKVIMNDKAKSGLPVSRNFVDKVRSL
ncbi:MAG TPA: LytTR family DNA-binding domain-containing protein [Fibrobacteraceae bacterium]|nr:LytTR family DNA-binding domain-containing protein [Fibrobacteraceae bacterium]